MFLHRVFLGHILLKDERGASAVEYALFMAFVAAVIFGVVLALGQLVLGLFNAPITAGF